MENKPVCKIDENCTKRWTLNGKYHREDGPAIEYPDGHKQWWINGKLHRLDGPALERTNGTLEWYTRGKRHRLDGPAFIAHNGVNEWFINGNHVTKEITQWAKENDIDLENLSEYDISLIKLIWGNYGNI